MTVNVSFEWGYSEDPCVAFGRGAIGMADGAFAAVGIFWRPCESGPEAVNIDVVASVVRDVEAWV